MASALYSRWDLGGPWAAALRPEFFWDRNGLMTTAQQLLWAMTSTLDYHQHLGKQLAIVRLEYRYDRSTGLDGGLFKDGNTAQGAPKLIRDQHVLWLGLMWAFDS